MSKASFGSYDPQSAVAFVAEQEGLSLKAYKCPAGKWTIGYGHTGTIIKGGEKVAIAEGMRITEAQAQGILHNDLCALADSIMLKVYAPVTAGQYVAVLSLAYNIGLGNFAGSTLLKKLNACKYAEAADEFLKWKYIGKTESKGLLARRERERALFLEEEA